jgi:hypothetical protein
MARGRRPRVRRRSGGPVVRHRAECNGDDPRRGTNGRTLRQKFGQSFRAPTPPPDCRTTFRLIPSVTLSPFSAIDPNASSKVPLGNVASRFRPSTSVRGEGAATERNLADGTGRGLGRAASAVRSRRTTVFR